MADKQMIPELLKQALADELEQLLQMKVDLVSREGIKPRHFALIEPDLIYI